MKTKKYQAELIIKYLFIYKGYLINNNLDDDCDTLTIKDLVQFVEYQIDKEDWEFYKNVGKNIS